MTGTAVGSTSGAIALSAFPDTTLITRLTYPSATRPSKFRVGPTFLAGTWPLTYGPYWVVAAGECCFGGQQVAPPRPLGVEMTVLS